MIRTLSPFNPTLARTSVNHLITNFDSHNHEHIFELSTEAEIHVQQYQLVALLDLRAQALGMKGYFKNAVQDAKEIIMYAPEWSIGYLRLGHLLHMQGKQLAAISLYNDALMKVSRQEPGYQQLVQDKKKAEKENEKCVDMVTKLPFELVDNIFEYLPEKTKVIASMDVSKEWRAKTCQSQTIWRTIWNDFDHRDNKSAALVMRVIPHIAHHVKSLTTGPWNLEVEEMYFDYMEKGYFKKIESLVVTGQAFYGISYILTMPFTNALWGTRNTLTKLTLVYRAYYEIEIHLSEILFYCKNLQTLVLDSDDRFDWFIGHKEYPGRTHNALMDVEITAPYTTGQGFRPLLKNCPNIRRLCLKEFASDVVDIVTKLYNEKLEIFAFNPSVEVTSLEKIDREFYDGPPGLREVHYHNGGYGPAMNSFAKLLRINQASLQRVYADMSLTKNQSEEVYTGFTPGYEQWYFKRLQHLTFRPGTRDVMQTRLLQSIEVCTASPLIYFAAVDTPNISAITNTLIKLPPLEELKLSHLEYNDGYNNQRSSAIIGLFKTYAALPPLKQTFHTIWFEYCDFITEDVLDNLSQIATLKAVNFSGTCSVPSRESFRRFLKKVGHQLVGAMLVDIDHVDDDVLNILCEMEGLETVKLDKITKITEEGIKYLVDNTNTLRRLIIEDCITLTDDTVSYITKKISIVQIVNN